MLSWFRQSTVRKALTHLELRWNAMDVFFQVDLTHIDALAPSEPLSKEDLDSFWQQFQL